MAGVTGHTTLDLGVAPDRAGYFDWLVSCREADRLAMVVGSGVSQFAPANVPVASVATQRLHRLLLGCLPLAERRRVARLTSGIPFEVLIGRLRELDEDWAGEVARRLVSTDVPNGVHEAIAAQMEEAQAAGARLPIVTTNYDEGIHHALLERGLAVNEIIAGGEPPASGLEILYIHGYVEQRTSLVLDFRSEFALSAARVRHLVRLVAGRELLVLGFSGGDLDVSEALAEAGPAGIAWVRASAGSADPSRWPRGARDLLGSVPESARRVVVCHDRLGAALDASSPDLPGADRAAVHRRLAAALEAGPRSAEGGAGGGSRIWAGWMAARSGAAGLAAPTAELARASLGTETQTEILSFGAYYSGRYLDAARLQRAASGAAAARGDLRHAVYHAGLEVEFLNRGGQSPSALWAYPLLASRLAPRWASLQPAQRASARADLREVVALSGLVWPASSLRLLLAPRRGRAGRRDSAPTSRTFDRGLVAEAMGAGASDEALALVRERFTWLGQGARLINVLRVAALHRLLRSEPGSPRWQTAADLVTEASARSAYTEDPFRTGRTALLQLEAPGCTPRAGDVADAVRMMLRAQAWRPMLVAGLCLYGLGLLLRSRHLRLGALLLLETS